MRLRVQVEAASAGRVMGELLQQELDVSKVPAPVRHSLQLVLGTDASMARCMRGSTVDAHRLLTPAKPERTEIVGSVDTTERHPRKRQCLAPHKHDGPSQQLHQLRADISFISKQLEI